eukprot:scaffold208264_cov32-Tisochrysis_lutea.AAC.2
MASTRTQQGELVQAVRQPKDGAAPKVVRCFPAARRAHFLPDNMLAQTLASSCRLEGRDDPFARALDNSRLGSLQLRGTLFAEEALVDWRCGHEDHEGVVSVALHYTRIGARGRTQIKVEGQVAPRLRSSACVGIAPLSKLDGVEEATPRVRLFGKVTVDEEYLHARELAGPVPCCGPSASVAPDPPAAIATLSERGSEEWSRLRSEMSSYCERASPARPSSSGSAAARSALMMTQSAGSRSHCSAEPAAPSSSVTNAAAPGGSPHSPHLSLIDFSAMDGSRWIFKPVTRDAPPSVAVTHTSLARAPK